MAAYQFGVGEYVDSEGHKVEILGERNGNLIGVVHDSNHVDELRVARWNKDGTYRCGPKAERLLPSKQTRTMWVNIYEKTDECCVHESLEMAKQRRVIGVCIATVPVTIEFVPGDGLQ